MSLMLQISLLEIGGCNFASFVAEYSWVKECGNFFGVSNYNWCSQIETKKVKMLFLSSFTIDITKKIFAIL